MRTLFIKTLISELRKGVEFKALVKQFGSGSWPLDIQGTEGVFRHMVMDLLFSIQKHPVLMVYPRIKELSETLGDLTLFESSQAIFPELNTIPYKGVSPHTRIMGERVLTLSRLLNGEKLLISTTERCFLSPLPPPEWLESRIISLKKGDDIDLMEIEEKLSQFGYLRVPRVSVEGEFALRGEVLDIFMPGIDQAVRIVFEFDEVEEIKLFSTDNQSSSVKLASIDLYPMREIIWDEERIVGLERFFKKKDKLTKGAKYLIDMIRDTGACPHEEMLFPFSFENPGRLTDYLPGDAPVVFSGLERMENYHDTLKKEYYEIFMNLPAEADFLPAPDLILRNFRSEQEKVKRSIRFFDIRDNNRKKERLHFTYEGPRSFFGNIPFFKEELDRLIDSGYKIGIFAESESQATRIEQLLSEYKIEIIPHGISHGFTLPDLKYIVIQENEIFGRKKRVAQSVKRAKTEAIDTFVELNTGDFVVHINYGIGRFEGIERIKTAKTERDYIKLAYADDETIFIPIEQVNMIQRYIGSEGRVPALDKIGGKSWEKKKNRVRKSVEDLADHLIKIYSRRKKAVGFSFPKDTDWQIEFEAAFPYQETRDQLSCVEDIKGDMESPKPMDRLVCGDVGYGKTEVAMRAAFKAVVGGKQVAFLAPTTILAEQHLENCQERFSRFPVKFGMVSRFVTKKEQKVIIESAGKGELDILIGTHRLLQKDVKFKNLGLIIIDEEQRFGVKHKERFKEMKSSVDCLTLSATPIPRTLHMSLLKIRDMSLLTTAPSNRRPIETFIREFDPETVAEAVRKELKRGGQVFYLHNRVETLEEVQLFLTKLIPEAMIESAHGQMTPNQLEDKMHRFIHGSFQVLVATTIIENGIDIPNVNTIIIDRADMYGISQLYQLRGRVGRSDKTAFAYLLYPEQRALSEIAMKRLQIISDYTELGSGFKIAMKDLEVRGAGNLLGREQSGDVMAVGFDMYIRLLDEAIREMQDDPEERLPEVYMELVYTGFIPDTYISEPVEKMEIYKKISSIQNQDEYDRVLFELDDRFGPIPEEVLSLLSLSEIRIICGKLKISSIKERSGIVEVEFGQVALISIDKIMRLIREGGKSVALDPRRPQYILLKTGNIGLQEKSEFIRDRLSRLL
ncbi:MAG: transcription-repair coupling factor [Spirochaetales bacterium]|nr:transcription-repair coupling factor [Spirochaetales bacterium]